MVVAVWTASPARRIAYTITCLAFPYILVAAIGVCTTAAGVITGANAGVSAGACLED